MGDLADVVDASPGVADKASGDGLCRAETGSHLQLTLVGSGHRLQVQVVRKQPDVAAGQLQTTLHHADLQWEVLQCEHGLQQSHTQVLNSVPLQQFHSRSRVSL